MHACYGLSGADESGDRRGVVASCDVAASPGAPVEIAVVPFDAMLHSGSALVCGTPKEAKAAKAFASVVEQLTREDDVLGCRLLFECHKGAASRWGRHLALLPETPEHCVLRWSDEDLDELRGSDAGVLARRWRAQLVGDFDDVMAACRSTAEALYPGPKLSTEKKVELVFPWLTRDRFTWAITMIWSRGVTVTRRGTAVKALVPVVDMHNHDARARATHRLRIEAIADASDRAVASLETLKER